MVVLTLELLAITTGASTVILLPLILLLLKGKHDLRSIRDALRVAARGLQCAGLLLNRT